MATIDTSLYGRIGQGVKSFGDYEAEDQQRQSNKLAMMSNLAKWDEHQRSAKREENLLRVQSGWTAQTPLDQKVNDLYGIGAAKEADALRTSDQTHRKGEMELQNGAYAQAEKGYGKYLELAAGFYSDPQLSREKVAGGLSQLVQFGMMKPELAQQLTASLPEDPTQLRETVRRAVTSRLKPEEVLTMFAPTVSSTDTGGRVIYRDTNANSPTFGKEVMPAVMKTMTPGESARLAEERRQFGVRQAAGPAGQQAPSGYRWRADGALEPVPGGPADLRVQKQQMEMEGKRRGLEAAVAAVDSQIGVIDKALNHPGREAATGLSGTLNPKNYIPGTDATDFRVVLDQIGGAAFMQAFESLKGGGAITEMEGKKATDAIARLNRAQSDGEFKASLQELRKIMADGQARLRAGASAPTPQAGPRAGTVQDGYRFRGGNPADPNAWEKL